MVEKKHLSVEDKALKVPVSNSLLESLERRGDREAPTPGYPNPEFPPESIIDYYNECLEKIDPNGEQALKDAVRMYNEK